MANHRCFQDTDTFYQNHTQHIRQDKTGQNVSADEVTFIFFRTLQPINLVAQWLMYCATNQRVTVSIPDGVMELFI
jgi:hypothetical protein